jgi:putative tryptophan/tyrosine transport system substrate-binding protein
MRVIGLAVVLTFGLGLVAAPLVHEAHAAGQVPRVGILETGAPSASEYWPAFHQRLRELGYAEGQTITFESRSAGGRNERLPGLAVELVGLKVDIIVTTGTPAAVAAKQATATIPIVMAVATDPVGAGLTASLGRPGGNVTGLANLDAELSGKRLEMFKAAVPALSRVAILWNPANPAHKQALRDTEAAALALAVRLQPVEARNPGELNEAFSAMRQERTGGLVLLADSMFSTHRARILDFAAKGRLPSIFWQRAFAEAGAFMSYGTSYPDLYRGAANFVDKILKGAKPVDLPVEQPTKFELVINLKTAKALGLTIPQTLLLRADQVIE